MLVRFTWDLPADATHVTLMRHAARLLLEHQSIIDDDVDEVELMIGEMCANVVRHAYDAPGGRYSVEFTIDGPHLCISVTDTGRGFGGRSAKDEREFTEAGGMGIYLISQFADEVKFEEAENGGICVTAMRRLKRQGETPQRA